MTRDALQTIKSLPTIMINSGGADLKIDEPTVRVWLEPDGQTVVTEVLNPTAGRWEILSEVGG